MVVHADTCGTPPFREEMFIFVPVNIGDGYMVQALVDTGATSTLVARCLLPHFSFAKDTGEVTQVVLADGAVREIETWVVTFQVDRYLMLDFRVQVADVMPAHMIVGMDVLTASRAIVYPRERTVVFQE